MADKSDPRFDAVLDANDPDFGEQLVTALGLEPGERVEIIRPQFDRDDGIQPVTPSFDFNNLRSYPDATLRAMGCCLWDEPDENGDVLWLFPADWYDHIPEGFVLTCIDGEDEAFQRGVTDDDRRCGVLAYGLHRRAEAAPGPAKTGLDAPA